MHSLSQKENTLLNLFFQGGFTIHQVVSGDDTFRICLLAPNKQDDVTIEFSWMPLGVSGRRYSAFVESSITLPGDWAEPHVLLDVSQRWEGDPDEYQPEFDPQEVFNLFWTKR